MCVAYTDRAPRLNPPPTRLDIPRTQIMEEWGTIIMAVEEEEEQTMISMEAAPTTSTNTPAVAAPISPPPPPPFPGYAPLHRPHPIHQHWHRPPPPPFPGPPPRHHFMPIPPPHNHSEQYYGGWGRSPPPH